MQIAIIGAGIAGLAAGYRLQQAGFETIIFEREKFAGGRTASERVDDFVIDRGAYTIPEFHQQFLALITELGLGSQLIETASTTSIFEAGQEHRMKIGSYRDFFRYRLLSLKQKKDLIELYLKALALGRHLNLNQPTAKTFELEAETAAEFLTREYDTALLEKIAYPIFAEHYLGLPETNSRAALLASIRGLARFKIYSLNSGMGAVAQKLADGLDVRYNTPVTRIRSHSPHGPIEVLTQSPGSSVLEQMQCDFLIVAVPIPVVTAIWPDMPAIMKPLFRQMAYSPSIVVALGLDQPFEGASLVNCTLRSEYACLATVVMDCGKGPGRIPDGKGLATAILTEPASRKLLPAADEKIVAAVMPELGHLYPQLPQQVKFTRVYKWAHGAVQLPPLALLNQWKARKTVAESCRALYFAGDGMNKASIEVALRSGYAAADRILGQAGSDGSRKA